LVSPGSSSAAGGSISIIPLSLSVDTLPSDPLEFSDTQQLKFFIMATDGNQLGVKLDLTATNPIAIRANELVNLRGDTAALQIFVDQVDPEIYVWFLAVDVDDTGGGLNPSGDQFIELGISAMRQTLVSQVSGFAISTLSLEPTFGTLLSFAINQGIRIWGEDDLIGQQAYLLHEAERWNIGTYSIPVNGFTLDFEIRYNPPHDGQATPMITVDGECAQSPLPILKLGDIGVVDFESNENGALRIRSMPRIQNGTVLATAADNHRLRIVAGPICSDGFRFWEVQHEESGKRGFAADGIIRDNLVDYWICPFSDPECGV
jgi:hypothetical protein